MSLYMVMGRYSHDAIEAMVESGTDREQAARTAVEAAGGKLLSFYGLIGQEYQVAIVFEVPGTAELLGALMPAITSGVLDEWKTIPLCSAAELVQGAALAKKVTKTYPGIG